ncbi:MAG: hypothetical protein Q9184_005764 [Pyrenodesmia sp. 2 TL-2023]
MYTFRLNLLLCATALFSSTYCTSFTFTGDNLLSTRDDIVNTKRSTRQLIAAQVESHIGKRSIGEALRCDHALHYVDGMCFLSSRQARVKVTDSTKDSFGGEDDRRLAAQVHLTTKLATLALEDIDHHIDYVSCSERSIVLGFVTLSSKQAAIEELRSKDKFYLVTSHDTCNNDGERNIYLFRGYEGYKADQSRVSAVTGSSDGNLDLTLLVTPARWKDSVQSISINFGKSSEDYLVPGQGKIQRRQAPSAPNTTVVVATAAATSTVEIDFPAPPSSTPTATSAQQDLSFQWIDTALLPPSFPNDDSLTLNAPAVPQGVTISCKNCTVKGTIDIMQASISGNATSSDDSEDDDLFEWDSGSFTFEVNGFSAHIHLEATVQATADLATFTAPIPSIGIPGFSIPGIGAVGPIFKPAIVLGAQVGSELEFGYGFNLTIPDSSSIILDLGEPTNSSVNGFPDAQITPLPFTASVEKVALTISASFRPELLLGASIFRSTLGAGVFLDLPTISATVSQVAQVNDRCEPIPDVQTPNNASSTIVDGVLEDVFGSLTHIESNLELGVGVLAQGQLGLVDAEAVFTVFNTSFPGPTTCLSFDGEQGTLGAVVATGAAGGGEGRGAVPSGTSPSAAGKERKVARVETVAALLLGVCACFVGL